jgi:hypothetical protein
MRAITMRKVALLLMLVAPTGDALAATISLKCKNPRREYLIEFNDVTRQVLAKSEEGSTNYPVSEVKEISGGYLIKGRIPNGPDYKLSTGKQKSIRFVIGPGNVQTDSCQ